MASVSLIHVVTDLQFTIAVLWW